MQAMKALRASSFPSFTNPLISRTIFEKPLVQIALTQNLTSSLPTNLSKKAKFKNFTAFSPSVPSTEDSENFSLLDQETDEAENPGEKFDWHAQWYPITPISDLDKRRPHRKRVLGIDIVIWWDRNENEWKVFDDSCPHRLAPLSQGRIDQWGRLQCVYHGWCFGGSGNCKFIPQATRDGPPVHSSPKACVAVYPSYVQNNILWFWANSDPMYKDIHLKKKPPYIAELDDPSFTNMMICREIPYGYELLVENLMDPAHIHYSHYGIMRVPETPKREGGMPLDMSLRKLDINGFTGESDGNCYFIPPCVLYYSYILGGVPKKQSTSSAGTTEEPASPVPQKRVLLVFLCIPVSPGNSRLIFASPRNFGVWIDCVVPRWLFHIGQNLILDSDLYLLHVEERKLAEIGPLNWHKSCYLPTKADVFVVAFWRWMNKYGGAQLDFGTKYSGLLPPTPPREQLFDRYWSHTVNCSSCNLAYKRLTALEIALQVISVASIGIVAAGKLGLTSAATRRSQVAMAVICFVASKWLSHFTYKTFRYHDYDHAFR